MSRLNVLSYSNSMVGMHKAHRSQFALRRDAMLKFRSIAARVCRIVNSIESLETYKESIEYVNKVNAIAQPRRSELEYSPRQSRPNFCPNTTPSVQSTLEKVIKNGRRGLRILLKGVEHLACPDTGSDKNIISEDFAKENKFRIRCGKKDKKRFELGSGEYVESLGRARLPCGLAKGTASCAKQWFHVLAGSIVPLIMGRSFLEETQVLTKNRHLLERCPPHLGGMSQLKFIGSPRKKSGVGVSMNGRILVATPDTGSDLNLISLACAERERFKIDKGREGRLRLENADGSITETVGRVHIASISLDLRMSQTDSNIQDVDLPSMDDSITNIPGPQSNDNDAAEASGEVFYVVDGLACDIILGDDFLERSDAFNKGTAMFNDSQTTQHDVFGLKIFKLSGRAQTKWNKTRLKPPDIPSAEVEELEHDDKYRKERFRRSEEKRRIQEMLDPKRGVAWTSELAAIEAFDQLHAECAHCRSRRS